MQDPIYPIALKIIQASPHRISISILQRRLQIGWNRAASLIDRMVADGALTKSSNALGGFDYQLATKDTTHD